MTVVLTKPVPVKIRQTEEQYRWAEYQRRVAEEEAAWAFRSEMAKVKEAATRRAVEFRDLCDKVGVSPFTGDTGLVEQYLWNTLRGAAIQDLYYAGSVWRSRRSFVDEARARWMETL